MKAKLAMITDNMFCSTIVSEMFNMSKISMRTVVNTDYSIISYTIYQNMHISVCLKYIVLSILQILAIYVNKHMQ